MNWRAVVTDTILILAIVFFFIFFMPYQLAKYMYRCDPTPEIYKCYPPEDAPNEYDIEWDIEEVINMSDYIDDLDIWDETFGKNK